MRGADSSGDWDHAWPDSADITDWKNKINNPSITYSNSELYSYSINTKAMPGGVSSGVEDVIKYSETGEKSSIVFYYGTTKVYAVKRDCANPLGSMPGLPVSGVWSITPTVSGPTGSTAVGGQLTWTHKVTNAGPDATDEAVTYRYKSSGYADFEGSGPVIPPGTLASGSAKNAFSTGTSVHTVRLGDVGQTLCRVTRATPESSTSAEYVDSYPPACIYIPYVYSLTPSVVLSHLGGIEAGTSFSATPTVDNSGPSNSDDTTWQLTKIVVPAGTNLGNSGGGNSNLIPCSYFTGTGVNCSSASDGEALFNVDDTVTRISGDTMGVYPDVASDLNVGDRICYALSVKPRSSTSTSWRHSEAKCVVIGIRPKMQIWGGDLIVGGATNTSTSRKIISGQNRTFGSWVEYAIFATGSISGTASGSAFADHGMPSSSGVCGYSTLSFTNTPTGSLACTGAADTIGHYSSVPPSIDIGASFPGGAAIGAAVVANDLTSGGLFVGSRAGNLTLNTSLLGQGKSVVLKVSGTVTILGNQTYNNGPYTSISRIPQLVIIADNINIRNTVTRVDAWLIASGDINTCSNVSTSARLTSSICNNPLRVNGPVMADKIYLRRTAGSGTGWDSGDPAEVFNLRADTYLWAYSQASGTGRIQTVHTTELPPRY
ncbi:MAG: hypothetical protein JXM68_10750 [Sedimentisphaerales bacterium]|nr:hypothetical protein [Sedimentisphaerales bacterium]